jgi:hypothetical protein
MIKMKRIFTENGVNIFQCDHCEQDITVYSLHLSVFLYGAAFLKGEEICYFGFTCPCCIKTVMAEGKDIEPIRQLLSWFDFDFRGCQSPVDLRYHSSVVHHINLIPELKNFDILFTNINISSGSEQQFRNELSPNGPLSRKGYVCLSRQEKVHENAL